jgi:hypothetical protein
MRKCKCGGNITTKNIQYSENWKKIKSCDKCHIVYSLTQK